jgi:S-adenosylmethionine decarboxylase proenzyme
LLLELEDCEEGILNDLEGLREAMMAAATGAGATVMGDSFHHFNPHGVSGVVVIAESHLTIHTWPEYAYAAADIFTCGTTVEPAKAAEVLVERLGARNHEITEIRRGIHITERVRSG